MEPAVPNIGPRERVRRLAFGLVSLAGAAVLAVLLGRSAIWLRALVFLPLLGAGYGLFQHREKT